MLLIAPGDGDHPVLAAPVDASGIVAADDALGAADAAVHASVPLVAEAEATFKRTIKGVTVRIQFEIKNQLPKRGVALSEGTTLKGPKLIKKFELDRASKFKLVEAFAGRLLTLTTFDEESVANAIGAAPQGFQLEVKVGEVGVKSTATGHEIDAAILKLELKLVAVSLLDLIAAEVPEVLTAVEAYERYHGLDLDIRAHGSVEWSLKPTKRMTLRLLTRLVKSPAGRKLLASVGILARLVPGAGYVLIALDVIEYAVMPFVLPMISEAFARRQEALEGAWTDFVKLVDSAEKLLAVNPLVAMEMSSTQHYLETLLMAHPDNQVFDPDVDDEVVGIITEIGLVALDRLTGHDDLLDALRMLNRTMRHLHPEMTALVGDLVASGADLTPLLDDDATAPTVQQLLSMKPFDFFSALHDAGLFDWNNDPEFEAEDRIDAMLADIASGV